jgi:hypothetical protein
MVTESVQVNYVQWGDYIQQGKNFKMRSDVLQLQLLESRP